MFSFLNTYADCDISHAVKVIETWQSQANSRVWDYHHTIAQATSEMVQQDGQIGLSQIHQLKIVQHHPSAGQIIYVTQDKVFDYDPDMAQAMVYDKDKAIQSPMLGLFLGAHDVMDVAHWVDSRKLSGDSGLSVQFNHHDLNVFFDQGRLEKFSWVDAFEQQHTVTLLLRDDQWLDEAFVPQFPAETDIIED